MRLSAEPLPSPSHPQDSRPAPEQRNHGNLLRHASTYPEHPSEVANPPRPGFTPFYREPGLRGAHQKGGAEAQVG